MSEPAMVWNVLSSEIIIDDQQLRTMIGPGGLTTREEARAVVQAILDGLEATSIVAEMWRAGAVEDTVYWGPFAWAIYQYPADEDPRIVAHAWLEDFAETMRTKGINVHIAGIPKGAPHSATTPAGHRYPGPHHHTGNQLPRSQRRS